MNFTIRSKAEILDLGLTIEDFQLVNTWVIDSQNPHYITDQTTGRRYFHLSPSLLRESYFCEAIMGVPITGSVQCVVREAYYILRFALFADFWVKKLGEEKYNFKARLLDSAENLLRIAVNPISLIGLECAAIYGIFRPNDGRKLFASIERALVTENGPCMIIKDLAQPIPLPAPPQILPVSEQSN